MTRHDESRGGLREYNDGRIVNSNHKIIVMDDGEFIRPIRKNREARERANNILWSRIGPLEFHGVTIKRNTRLYHEEREEHLRAKEIDVTKEGIPYVTFRVVDSDPVEYVEIGGERLAELTGDGTLKDDEQIHNEVMEALGEI